MDSNTLRIPRKNSGSCRRADSCSNVVLTHDEGRAKMPNSSEIFNQRMAMKVTQRDTSPIKTAIASSAARYNARQEISATER